MNRLDANSNPAQIARLLAAARKNAESLAAIDDSNRATLSRGFDSQASGAISIPGHQLVCEIHRGGQGVVYQAIRESTGHDVAIKVLHDRRAASPRELERFEREAAVLRDLNHPNLIAISEVGVVEGRPYLVMPYIAGWPLDEHVRRNGLSVRDMLELFLKVCDAVNVAHLNGVIHRDLKPSNIRVDDSGEPHVLDFGLAKTATPSHGESLTETGQFVGSMPWASPEQADPSFGRVDVRTDVYSLGAVLYQLLTGRLPIDPIGSQREVLNRIVTAEPTSLRALRVEINDEVETIVLKCLSKDRARRYSNADGLAADIRRYLAGEAIEAKRDSITYVVRKLVRKHRGLVGATGLVLLVGAVGGTTSFVLWQESKHESQRAADARDDESAQRARAEAINTFLTDMLTAAQPAKAKGAKLTVREALDTAAKRIDEHSLPDQPLVEAEIRFTIGSTYWALSLPSDATRQFRAADALQSHVLGDEHPDTLRTRFNLARSQIRTDFASTAKLAQATLETQRRVLGPDHLDTLRTMVLLGVAHGFAGRFAESESHLLSAIEGRRRTLGQDHADTAYFLNRLGELYTEFTYPDKAEPLHREALRIHTQALGEEHPDTITSMRDLAQSLYNQDRPEEAEAIYRKALEPSIRILGPEHPETLAFKSDLAAALAKQGRPLEAEPLYRETLATLVRTLGRTDYDTITTQRFLAECLVRQGKFPEAETLLREALDAAREKYGPEDGGTSIRVMCALASVLAIQHKDADAEQVARQVLEFQQRQLPRPALGQVQESSWALIQVLKRRGASEEALRVEQQLIESWLTAARAPDASAKTLYMATWRLLNPSNAKLRDAPQALELALRLNEKSAGQDPSHLRTLAQAYLLSGDPQRATEIWKQAIAVSTADESRAITLNVAAWELLNVKPETLRDPPQALEFALKANDLSRHENPFYLATLAMAYHRTGETTKAIDLQKKAIALLAADAPNSADFEDRLREYQAALNYEHGSNRNEQERD